MSRQNRPLRLTEEYRPDPLHCAAALLRLAGVKMARPDTTPAPAPTCGEATREDQAGPLVAPEADPGADPEDHQGRGRREGEDQSATEEDRREDLS